MGTNHSFTEYIKQRFDNNFWKIAEDKQNMDIEFDEVMWGSLLECVKVYAADNIIFKFWDVTEVKG